MNLRDSEGGIALHTAAAFGEMRIVRKLILAGSDVNALAGSGHLDVVRLLVDSLRSKRFRGVWEPRTGFLVLRPRGQWGESQK